MERPIISFRETDTPDPTMSSEDLTELCSRLERLTPQDLAMVDDILEHGSEYAAGMLRKLGNLSTKL